MSDLGPGTNEIMCPFAELLDRHVTGDSSSEDDARLDEHVGQGCPSCAPRFHEWNRPVAPDEEAQLESLIVGAMRPIEDQVEARRLDMLRKISARISKEEKNREGRVKRRRSLNTLLFGTIGVTIALLMFGYVATLRLATWKVRAQREQAFSEIGAILDALRRYSREHGFPPLESVPLGKSLEERRLDLQQYFEPRHERRDENGRVTDSAGIDGEGYLLDPWGRRYVYKRVTGGARIRSLGPNGKDEGGTGDDITGDVPFDPPPKREKPNRPPDAPPPKFDPTDEKGLLVAYAAFKADGAAQQEKRTDPDAAAALQAMGLLNDEGDLVLDAHGAYLDSLTAYKKNHRAEWDEFVSKNDGKWHDYVTSEHKPNRPK
ncbi:hypothetical protein HY251_10695 [bacterium]|nr:hypothetical protein [bacterium]